MKSAQNDASQAEERRKKGLLFVLLTVLLAAALFLFWPAVSTMRNQAAVNERSAFSERKGTMSHGPGPMSGGGPFAELGLTDEQRKKIDGLMQEQMDKAQKDAKPDGPVMVAFPMDKIRSVLTPEQQKKLDAHEKAMRENMASGKGDTLLPPPSGGDGPTLLHQNGKAGGLEGGPGGPSMLFIRKSGP